MARKKNFNMTEVQTSPDHFVFLDRDGVINAERGDYTKTVEEWEWAPGSLEGIKALTVAGFGIIVITNQACISKGIMTERDLSVLHEFMIKNIRESGGDIIKIYHCPHVNADNCKCRKPEPGMLLRAAEDFAITLSKTFFIGDSQRDMEAANRAGARFILINNTSLNTESKSEYRAENLLNAAEIVINKTQF